MPSPRHHKSQPGIPKEPEFTFHLVSKSTATGTDVVAGAIVKGPVATLFDDAMGSAFDGKSGATSPKPGSLKSASTKKNSAKPKAKH
jgi:hypothetical protein